MRVLRHRRRARARAVRRRRRRASHGRDRARRRRRPGDQVLVHAGVALVTVCEVRRRVPRRRARPACWPGEILASVEPGRHYKIMEVCGGHTHSIYKYGVDDLLPAERRAGARPGLPGLRDPDGPRRRRRSRWPSSPGVIFTCFGDMMRVPGSHGTLLDAKAEGADVRMVYSPLDALRIAKAQPRPRGRVLRDRLRDDGARPPRSRSSARRPRASPNFSLHLQPRHDRAAAARAARLARPAARRLHRPGPRVARSSARGRSSSSPRDYGKPVVIAGFEPLDILQAIQMILAQLRRGPLRGREPVQARRAVARATRGRSR